MRTVHKRSLPYQADKTFVFQFSAHREFPVSKFQNKRINRKYFAGKNVNKENIAQMLVNGISYNYPDKNDYHFGNLLDGLEIYKNLRFEINPEKPWRPSLATRPDYFAVELLFRAKITTGRIFRDYKGPISEDPTAEEVYEVVKNHLSSINIKTDYGFDPNGNILSEWGMNEDGEERIFIEGAEICYDDITGLLEAIPIKNGVAL